MQFRGADLEVDRAGPGFEVARRRGESLALADAVDMAAAGWHLAARSGATLDATLRLTPREREVAALLRRGWSNRRISEALTITEGTAGLHVKHILGKLGFESRAQVAAWAVEQELTQRAPR
jgi:non-specific serine/threonine protein kinase